MCGVAAVWRPAPDDADDGRVRRMLRQLRHRGPDGDAVWQSPWSVDSTGGSITLGLCRLAIVDTTATTAVAVDGVGPDVVAAVTNGELYNHAALRRRLGAAAVPGVDTNVVPALFRQDGRAFAARLRGMFASVVAHRGQLHLFRDPLGKKPLFYRRRGDAWLVASEMKGLFPDDTAIADVGRGARAFVRGFLDDDEPFLAGVMSVPPGGHVTIDGRGPRTERVVSFDDVVDDHRRGGDAMAVLDALLGKAVRRRARLQVPARVLLSGGMDSAVVLGHARLPATTLAMPGPRNETVPAARVARRLGCAHNVVTARAAERASARRVLWHTESPDVGGAWQTSTALLDHAAALESAGVRVVLSGEGADELFLGYPWMRLDAGVVGGARQAPLVVGYGQTRLRHPEARSGEVWRRMLERPIEGAVVAAMTSLFPGQDPTMAAAVGPRAAAVDQAPHRARGLQLDALAKDMLTVPVLHADRLWMAHGIEARLPFLDVDLVRAALRLPREQLLDRRVAKPVVRGFYQALLGRPPPPKRGFAGERRPDDDTVLAWAASREKVGVRVVDGDGLRLLRRRAASTASTADVEVLWRALVVEECAEVCAGGPV